MNQIVRPQGLGPQVGTRDGDWVWDGFNWICSPCNPGGGVPPFPCPPPGFPPPGCPPWFSGMNSPPWYPGANAGVSFGTTAPPNPVRGHFWWDGQILWLFDGAAWVGVGGLGAGSGTITGSQPPANPQVGTQWFDGATLWIWTGTSWMAIGPSGGTISSPNPYQVVRFANPGSFSFTIPNDVTATTTWMFTLQAGGGGGGSASPTGTWSAQGGGGGEFKKIAALGLAAAVVCSCTVGAGGVGGTGGADGGAGGNTSLLIANTNTTVIANGGAGGWGDSTATNASGQGLGGKNGTFNPGTQNVQLVLQQAGGDAHFGVDINDSSIAGADSFMGTGAPAFNNQAGWTDTTGPQGNGSGGRGGYNQGDNGGNGTAGIVIIERFKN
jgi:hypothetical protein